MNAVHLQRAGIVLLAVGLMAGWACGRENPPTSTAEPARLRLASTTSPVDTGLFGAILPDFEAACDCRVDVIAVGSGQALALAARGDADVLLVHSPAAEARFLAEGHGHDRRAVMYNDFIIAGPPADPAGVRNQRSAAEALRAIVRSGASFASRGDRSGTHERELAVWRAAGIEPGGAWYHSLGQGMGETLMFASDRRAYALSDRATFLSMRDRAELDVLFGGASAAENPDRDLRNQYAIIPVSPEQHPGVRAALATRFADWITSKPAQARIGAFGADRFGQPLFHPDSDEYKATEAVAVRVGSRTRTFTLAELRALPAATLRDYEAIGVKKGPLGRHTWTGVSLVALLRKVDPSVGRSGAGPTRVRVTSSDGWQAVFKWPELVGGIGRGEALYAVKGCNECHGVDGEGTAPPGKHPAPRLAARRWSRRQVADLLRAGGSAHGGLNPYAPTQVDDQELDAMLEWLSAPGRAGGPAFVPRPGHEVALLAYERDGQPLTGQAGLIRLVVGFDEYAGRLSRWVARVEVGGSDQD